MSEVKRTERGWMAHYILADRCRFRRNTLLEYEDVHIVVSTVGLLRSRDEKEWELVGHNHYFETMAFHANADDRFRDPDTSRQVPFVAPWRIVEVDADDRANEMHERVCEEIAATLLSGAKL